MIGKLVKGSDFRGLATYLTREGRGQVLDLRHLASANADEAAAEMELAASVSRRCKLPVMHLTISYDPADGQPSDDMMRADAAEVLRNLGMGSGQAVIVRHHDKPHAHMHIMANRVGSDGRAVSDSSSYAKVESTLRRIEANRGLQVTEGRHAPSPATGKRMEGPRTTPDPRQHSAPDSVRDTLLNAETWQELEAGLARDGWRLVRMQAKNKKPGAILVGPDGQKIGAGKVDRAATLARLRSRLDPPKTAQGKNWSSVRAKLQPTTAPLLSTSTAGYAAARSAGLILTTAAKIGHGKTSLGTGILTGRKGKRHGSSLTSSIPGLRT
ncbi:relaxase/mobilization nuclease domain-containing protein [Falsirhodobacter xinxiangensis]|uniref:relaxase/mobilization nuclease domain-containing protein n=1 Tax=Falsirhodobacter xinxiangensis TaxID=2530049 RepID=UPI0010AB456D|nr:relaxase/mobilization nuclease domain-containing protein [Rhodobacter xinxiangensis]